MAVAAKESKRLVLTLNKHNAIRLDFGEHSVVVRLAPKEPRARVVIEAPEDVRVTLIETERANGGG